MSVWVEFMIRARVRISFEDILDLVFKMLCA